MKTIIQTALFLIIAILFQVSCDNLMKQTKENNTKDYFIQDTFGKWLNCQKPGNIDRLKGNIDFLCPQGEAKGLILNYDSKEIISASEINFESSIKLYCGCTLNGSGNWYKSPTQNPVTGQEVDLILVNKDQPLKVYQKGDILYCYAYDGCPKNDVFQKLTIK